MSFPGTFAPTLFSGVLFKNALSTVFNGADEYIDLGDDSSIKFEYTDPFSYSTWVKYDDLTGFQALFSTIDGSNSFRGMELIKQTDHKLQMTLIQNVGSNQFIQIRGQSVLTASTWYFISCTYDGSGTAGGMKIYINAVEETVDILQDVTITSTVIINGVSVLLGRRGNDSFYLNGNMDEPAFWDVELTGAHISEIYNSGAPNSLTDHSQEVDLVSWWRLGDDDSATTVFDQVGSNDGTLVNMDASNYEADVP